MAAYIQPAWRAGLGGTALTLEGCQVGVGIASYLEGMVGMRAFLPSLPLSLFRNGIVNNEVLIKG